LGKSSYEQAATDELHKELLLFPLFRKKKKKRHSKNKAFDGNTFLNVKSIPPVLHALGNSHRPFVFRKPGL